jgi:hypothetical protein
MPSNVLDQGGGVSKAETTARSKVDLMSGLTHSELDW